MVETALQEGQLEASTWTVHSLTPLLPNDIGLQPLVHQNTLTDLLSSNMATEVALQPDVALGVTGDRSRWCGTCRLQHLTETNL